MRKGRKSAARAVRAGPSHRGVEIGVAIATLIFALIVIGGSYRVGAGWDVDGPQAGFFPFYVGLMVLAASIVNLVHAWPDEDGGLFAKWGQLRQVCFVFIPTAIYVALIPFIGIYVASTLLIAVFMRWLGRYSWKFVSLVSIVTMIDTFLVFEKWFLVPLPKGPIENMLGF